MFPPLSLCVFAAAALPASLSRCDSSAPLARFFCLPSGAALSLYLSLLLCLSVSADSSSGVVEPSLGFTEAGAGSFVAGIWPSTLASALSRSADYIERPLSVLLSQRCRCAVLSVLCARIGHARTHTERKRRARASQAGGRCAVSRGRAPRFSHPQILRKIDSSSPGPPRQS